MIYDFKENIIVKKSKTSYDNIKFANYKYHIVWKTGIENKEFKQINRNKKAVKEKSKSKKTK